MQLCFISLQEQCPALEARQRLGLAVAKSGAEQSTSGASLMKQADPIKADNTDKLERKAEQHVSLGLGNMWP